MLNGNFILYYQKENYFRSKLKFDCFYLKKYPKTKSKNSTIKFIKPNKEFLTKINLEDVI